MGTSWGYARVSTSEQDVALQRDALMEAGVQADHVVADHVSGVRARRPGLDRLWEQMEPGDTLVIWKLDRLGRSLHGLIGMVDELGRRGVALRSLTEGIDTTTPAGRVVLHVMAALAEFERDLMRERTAAGLSAARAQGRQLGRPSRVTPEQVRMIRRLAAGGVPQRRIAATVGIPRSTVGRIIRGEVPSLQAIPDDPDEALM